MPFQNLRHHYHEAILLRVQILSGNRIVMEVKTSEYIDEKAGRVELVFDTVRNLHEIRAKLNKVNIAEDVEIDDIQKMEKGRYLVVFCDLEFEAIEIECKKAWDE